MSPKFVIGPSDRIFEALYDAGAIRVDPNYVRRCIIDLEKGEPAKIYLEAFADDALVDAVMSAGLVVANGGND